MFPASTIIIDRTFEEGVALTVEARHYIAFHEHADRRVFDLGQCLVLGYQHTRVSARLIQVLTWLLAMKALLAGEITAEEFSSPRFAFDAGDSCRSEQGADDANLPQGLRHLLQRSHSLYQRIERLDNMVRTRFSNGEAQFFSEASGARSVESA